MPTYELAIRFEGPEPDAPSMARLIEQIHAAHTTGTPELLGRRLGELVIGRVANPTDVTITRADGVALPDPPAHLRRRLG